MRTVVHHATFTHVNALIQHTPAYNTHTHTEECSHNTHTHIQMPSEHTHITHINALATYTQHTQRDIVSFTDSGYKFTLNWSREMTVEWPPACEKKEKEGKLGLKLSS